MSIRLGGDADRTKWATGPFVLASGSPESLPASCCWDDPSCPASVPASFVGCPVSACEPPSPLPAGFPLLLLHAAAASAATAMSPPVLARSIRSPLRQVTEKPPQLAKPDVFRRSPQE